MEKKFKLGVIGAGFMATAIVNGVIKSKIITPKQICVNDVNDTALTKISALKVKTTLDVKFLAENSEFLLFAVKPQNALEVLDKIKDCNVKKVITIMAGVKKDKIRKYLKTSKIARCMPNTPCSIGKGAIGADVSEFKGEDKKFVLNLLSSLSTVVSLTEDKLNAVTGISGSSPAYFYYFVKSIIDAGVENGLKESDAKILAVNTMEGAAEMIKQNPDKSIDDLITAVCSKGGTTIEAIKVFNNKKLNKTVSLAVKACIKRSKELENL